VAARWAGTLKGARLQVVMAANDGYLPGMTNFACRLARRGAASAPTKKAGLAPAFKKFKRAPAEQEDEGEAGEVSIPALLEEYAAREPGLRAELGADFARGHAQASGGVVRTEVFERLWGVMSAGAEGGSPKKGKGQRNTLEGWVKKK
jgi:hypothetical protein